MTHEIISIGAFQTSLVLGLVNFVFGVLSAIAMAVGHMAPMTPMTKGHPATLLWLPIGYAIGAFMVSVIFCLAYKALAKLVGGMQIELSADQCGDVREMQGRVGR